MIADHPRRLAAAIAAIGLCLDPLAGVTFQALEAGQNDPSPATPLLFDVASVRPNTSGGGSMTMGWQPGGAFRAVNAPLLLLIQSAYEFRDSQLAGAPDWASTERFDVTARAAREVPSSERTTILQALLRDRFKLAAHREFREIPIYALVTARDDQRLGPGLRASDIDCSPEGRASRAPTPGTRGAAGLANGASRPACGSLTAGSSLIAGGITLTQLATSLSRRVDRIVVDRTGLNGLFDVDLKWSALTTTSDDGPSIFTAVQEQLGLRLERGRGPVEVLVIDHVERPIPN